MSIIIHKNPNGDTRTAPKDVSFKEFQIANDMHIGDVKSVMCYLAELIQCAGAAHDYTKKMHEELFYSNFLSTINNGTNFVEDEWYKLHIEQERHHLLSRCPDDVDLLDVLEMIVDCVCAGMARSGEVRELEIDTKILEKAIQNTVEMIKNEIKVIE